MGVASPHRAMQLTVAIAAHRGISLELRNS
jgi:hypothetical protein